MGNGTIQYTLTIQSDDLLYATIDGLKSDPVPIDREQIVQAEGYVELADDGVLKDRKKVQNLGKRIYAAVFPKPIDGFFREQAWRKVAGGDNKKNRIRFRIVFQKNVSPHIINLPWEFMYCPDLDLFFGTDPRISLCCEYDDWQPVQGYNANKKALRILFVHTHPNDLEEVLVGPILKEIKDLNDITIDELSDPSPRSLQKKVQDYRPHIFHFLGHGRFNEPDGQFALLDKDGQALWYNAQSFSDIFREWQPLLIMLQSCEGGRLSDFESFSGGAGWLARRNIPAVIAMRYSISQGNTWIFNRRFYSKLAEGKSVDDAVQTGRNTLAFSSEKQNHCRRDFAAPILWMRLQNGRLFSLDKEETKIKTKTIPSYVSQITINTAYLESILWDEEELEKRYISLSGKTQQSLTSQSTEWPKGLIPNAFRILDKKTESAADKTKLLDTIEEALEIHPRFVLLGAPGAGKTTTLKKLRLDSAKRAINDPKALIPILIELSQWPDEIDSIPAYLMHARELQGLPPIHFKRMLILFDGLNEMKAEKYSRRIQMIEDWLRMNPSISVIITSRERDYLEQKQLSIPNVQVYPLEEKRIKLFLYAYLGKDDGEKLFHQLQPENLDHFSPRDLIHIADNPFLLAMLTYVFIKNKRLPESRGRLFQIFVQTLYEREKNIDATRGISYEDFICEFGKIAFDMHKQRSATSVHNAWAAKRVSKHFDANDLWKLGIQSSILLFSKSDTFLRFTHQLILEYFAAEELLNNRSKLQQYLKKPKFYKNQRLSTQWDEVIYTLMGISDSNDILVRLAEHDPFIAFDSLNHVPRDEKILFETKSLIIKRLLAFFESKNQESRTVAIHTLSKFDETVIPHLINIMDHGKNISKRASLKVLANFDSAEAIKPIIDAFNESNKWVRRDAADIIKQFDHSKQVIAVRILINEILNKKDSRGELVKTLVNLCITGNEQILYELLNSLRDEEHAKSICRAIAQMKNKWLIKSLVQNLTQIFSDKNIEDMANKFLYLLFETLREIQEKMEGQKKDWIIDLFKQFSSIGNEGIDKSIAKQLIQKIAKQDSQSARKTLNTLAEMGSIIVEFLIESLDTNDPVIRRRIPIALAKIGDKKAIKPIIKLLNDKDSFVRSSAANALGKIGDLTFANNLVPLLKDEDPSVRTSAANSMGYIGNNSFADILVPLLKDEDPKLRSSAANALGKIGDLTFAVDLVPLLKDEDPIVSLSAANALGKIGDVTFAADLVPLLKDEVPKVRSSAANALGKIGDLTFAADLVPLLKDEGLKVRSSAANALAKLRSIV